WSVTGVQTCALPILINDAYDTAEAGIRRPNRPRTTVEDVREASRRGHLVGAIADDGIARTVQSRLLDADTGWFGLLATDPARARSEERRVGEEGRGG